MTRHLLCLPLALASALFFATAAFAQLPTPTYGWNLGNTLEPPSGEGTWGPAASRKLIDAVAAAGFNTVRLPVAWDAHADPKTHKIDRKWMKRVKEVVDWCYARNLHVVLNSHWDNGWLENKVTDRVDPVIDAKLRAYWTQIATTFRDYDDRLLFAGANEPAVETAAQMATLTAYYQSFVDTVRATGGNNRTRWLVVQGPKTDIDVTDRLMNALPKDPTPDRLMVEVHFYAPFQFCLMNEDADWGKKFYFWGQAFHHPTRPERNASWGEEAYVEEEFEKMRAKFIARGVPVLLGEFQAAKRAPSGDLDGADHRLHAASRIHFHKTVLDVAHRKGLKPVYWDIAGQMFDWRTGAVTDPDNVRALTGGPALPAPAIAAPTP